MFDRTEYNMKLIGRNLRILREKWIICKRSHALFGFRVCSGYLQV